jgi:putative phosphoesterase
MRIAIVSDIHGNLAALRAVVSDIARRGVDAIVNLGDSLSGPLQPLETAEYLMAQSWVQLAGNHERQLLDFSAEKRGPSDRYAHSQLNAPVFEWMAKLKPAQRFSDEIFLCHGTPRSDIEYFLDTIDGPRARAATDEEVEERLGSVTGNVVVCGHTHIPRIIRSRQGQLLVNPGSVGLPAYEDDNPHYHVVENGSPDSRYAILERRNGSWSAQLLAVPYDHTASARLAKLRGRHDWEGALTHGYVKAANRSLRPTVAGGGRFLDGHRSPMLK